MNDAAPGRVQPDPGPVRRVLIVGAVAATLLGLPLVLAGGALLRRSGVAPSMPNAAALRLAMVDKGFACDAPVAETPPSGGVASALTCTGDGGVPLRVAAFRNPAARGAAPPAPTIVYGANWRIEVNAQPLADRLARTLTGTVAPAPLSHDHE